MWFSLSQQTAYFAASIAMGAAMAVLYDLIRAVRMLLRCGRISVLVTDVLFFFICGVLTSLFALPFNKGDVRAFILFGEAVGFLTYRLTLGSIFGRFYAEIARLLRRFTRKICEKLKKIYDCLLKAGAFLLYNIVESVDGVCRTALSGVRTLCSDRRCARQKRRSRRRTPAVSGGKGPVGTVHKTVYYPIPLRERHGRNKKEDI